MCDMYAHMRALINSCARYYSPQSHHRRAAMKLARAEANRYSSAGLAPAEVISQASVV